MALPAIIMSIIKGVGVGQAAKAGTKVLAKKGLEEGVKSGIKEGLKNELRQGIMGAISSPYTPKDQSLQNPTNLKNPYGVMKNYSNGGKKWQ